MKIIITGSLGHISKPLAEMLLAAGHAVTVISSRAQKQDEIEALGASAAIGSIEDGAFLTRVFQGADLVYCMIPPADFGNPDLDVAAHYDRIGTNYYEAIVASGVRRVVLLSSIGAHMERNSGLIVLHQQLETKFRSLPDSVAITFMRPGAFYYNLFTFIPVIKALGTIQSNYGEGDTGPWVAPVDIAAAIAEEIQASPEGRRVRYVASEVRSCNEIAAILGAAIGKPDLTWQLISDAEMLARLKGAGMNPVIAQGLVEMNAGIHSGELVEDYFRHQPRLGKVKLQDFARDFAAAYQQ